MLYVTVTLLSRGALATRQSMQLSRVHGLTKYTSVWLTNLAAKSVGHCCPGGLVRESQANWGDQWSIKPIAAVWRRRRKESGSVHITGSSGEEQDLVIGCNLRSGCAALPLIRPIINLYGQYVFLSLCHTRGLCQNGWGWTCHQTCPPPIAAIPVFSHTKHSCETPSHLYRER